MVFSPTQLLIRALQCLLLIFAGMAFADEANLEQANAGEAKTVLDNFIVTLESSPHTTAIDTQKQSVVDYEVGLGAIEKFSGAWRFKDSERLTGALASYTWQVSDGFTSSEMVKRTLGPILRSEQAATLFACEGRACGRGVQWANRVFNQRLLYGRESLQEYRVMSVDLESNYRLMIYTSSRSTDRQYVHVALLEILESEAADVGDG